MLQTKQNIKKRKMITKNIQTLAMFLQHNKDQIIPYNWDVRHFT